MKSKFAEMFTLRLLFCKIKGNPMKQVRIGDMEMHRHPGTTRGHPNNKLKVSLPYWENNTSPKKNKVIN